MRSTRRSPRLRLPDSADDPTIMEMSMDSSSIMDLSIQAESDDNIYSYIESAVVPEIERISGVSSVDMRGGARKYVKVELKEEEMEQYGLSMNEIVNAISTADFTITAGEINRGNVTFRYRAG